MEELRILYQYCLPIVNFDNVKAETVHSLSWRHKNTSCWIKMAADIYQNLWGQWKAEINVLLNNQTVCFSNAIKDRSQGFLGHL